MDTYRVYMNAGHLAVDNGATNAIKNMFDLASILAVPVCKDGDYWGADWITVENKDLEIVIDLLIDVKIPYRIMHHPEHVTWKGLITDEAKATCRITSDYLQHYTKLHFEL